MNPPGLFEDGDKLLIGALLYILWKQEADNKPLLLALLFILIA